MLLPSTMLRLLLFAKYENARMPYIINQQPTIPKPQNSLQSVFGFFDLVDENVNAFTYPQKLTFRTDHRQSLPEFAATADDVIIVHACDGIGLTKNK